MPPIFTTDFSVWRWWSLFLEVFFISSFMFSSYKFQEPEGPGAIGFFYCCGVTRERFLKIESSSARTANVILYLIQRVLEYAIFHTIFFDNRFFSISLLNQFSIFSFRRTFTVHFHPKEICHCSCSEFVGSCYRSWRPQTTRLYSADRFKSKCIGTRRPQ